MRNGRKLTLWIGLCALLVICLSVPQVSQAQVVKGSISGSIEDPQGAVVPGAQIKVTNAATGETATTTSDASGLFQLNLLSIGTYKVEVSKQGFRKAVFDGVAVSSAQNTGMGALHLEVGDVTTTVEVTEAPPLVDTTEAQISTTFTSNTLTTMPSILANQGLDYLALYTPGVSMSGAEGFSNSNGPDFAVEGIRGRNNDQQIDGQYNNDNSVGGPALFLSDTQFVQEYQLTTNNMSAEYGRNSGSVVNINTKSGGNVVHGSIYGTEGNSGFDALNNTDKQFLGLTQVPHYNDSFAGATVGGPMVKDHLFYFGGFDTEIIPQKSVDANGLLTPTPAGIAQLESCYPYEGGGISPALQVLTQYGPYGVTGGNPTTIGATTVPYLNPPNPNGSVTNPDGSTTPACIVDEGGVERTLSTGSHSYNWIYKMDLNTGKNRFYGRYMFNYSNFFNVDEGQAAAGYPVNVPALSQQYAFSWVRTISSRQTNEFRASYGRENVEFGGNSIGDTVPKDTAISSGLAVVNTGSGNLAFGPANNLPQGRIVNSYQLQDNWTFIKGRHALKAGFNGTYQRSPNYFLPYVNGGYTYTGYDAMAENTATAINVTEGDPVLDFREKDSFLYVQDDYKIKNNLTLNLGLTWSYYGQPANLFHNKTVAQQSSSDPFWDPSLPTSVTTFPSIPSPKASFGPNVGFAWTPNMDNKILGNNKTTIRGGYRLAYDPPFYNIYLNIASAAPNALAQTIRPGSLPTGCTFPSIPTDPFGPEVRASVSDCVQYGVSDPRTFNETNITPNFGPQRTSRWSFGVQRELSSAAALEVRYVGNHAGNLFQSIDANPYIAGIYADFPNVLPSGVTPCPASEAAVTSAIGRVNCNEGVIRQRTNSAYSDYDGLEVSLRSNNLWNQLTMTANYTYSKTTDNADEIFGSFGAGQAVAFSQDPLNYTSAEHGLSALDFPNQFSLLAMEALPFYKGQHSYLGHIFGGWEVSVAYIASSGQPYTAQQEFLAYSSGSPYLDSAFNEGFNSGLPDGGTRPFLGSNSAPVTQVGIYAADACNIFGAPNSSGVLVGPGCGLAPNQLVSLNAINQTGSTVTVTKSQVRFIANGYEADQIYGTPFGNVGRNTLRAAGTNNWNMSVIKNIKFWERVNLQLHLDAQDVFNHLQPNGSIDPFLDDAGYVAFGTGFGNTSVQTSPSRTVRMGLLLTF